MAIWTRNSFYSFRVIAPKIHLGKYSIDILKDDEFDFDGYTVSYGGTEYSVPQLKAMLGSWFVPATNHDALYRPQPAGVKVSHATPEARERGDLFDMGAASEEEAVVGTLAESREIRTAAREGRHERLEQIRSARNIQARERSGVQPLPENVVDGVVMDAEQFVRANPRRVGTAVQPGATIGDNKALERANALNKARIAARAAALEEIDPPKTKDEMGGRRHNAAELQGARRVGKQGKYAVVSMDGDGGQVIKKYKFSKGASVGSIGGGFQNLEVPGTNVINVASHQPIQQGRAVASTPQNREAGALVIPDPTETYQPQATKARQTTQVQREGNVSIDDVSPGGGTGDVDVSQHGETLAALLPGAAVAGGVGQDRREVAPVVETSEADEIADVVSGWNKKRNWQLRVKEAVKFYGDWPEALEAICGIESEAVVAQIKTQLADIT